MARNNLQVCDQNIYIFTLSKFHISQDNQVLTESSSRSKKMWEIFKFLLSNPVRLFSLKIFLKRSGLKMTISPGWNWTRKLWTWPLNN